MEIDGCLSRLIRLTRSADVNDARCDISVHMLYYMLYFRLQTFIYFYLFLHFYLMMIQKESKKLYS